MKQLAIELFWQKVEPEPNTGCWLWSGALSKNSGAMSGINIGYGIFRNGKSNLAHIFSYNYFIGEYPSGFQLDHLCRNPFCVNPKHLEPVTRQINIRRAWDACRANHTHCKHGHEFTIENTLLRPGKYKKLRQCKACAKIRLQEFYLKKKNP